MPSVPDTSHLPWWLGPFPSAGESLARGAQVGSAIASNMLRSRQMAIEAESNIRREETATNLKMMDLERQATRDASVTELGRMNLGLEAERNDLAIRTQKFKQEAEIAKANGMLEIGQFMGNAVRNDLLTDPETQSQWYELTSRLAPFVPDTVVNAWWDNTFKPAMERKEKAESVRGGAGEPAKIQEDKYAQSLLAEADDLEFEGFAEQAAKKRQQAESFKTAARLNPRDGNLAIRSVTDSSGQEHEVLVMSDGRERLLPFVDRSKISSLDLSTYNSELRALQKLYEDKDPSMLDEDGKLDSTEYQRRRDNLYRRFYKKQSAGAGAANGAASEVAPPSSGAGSPSFRFDPSTKKLLPIR